MIIDSLSDSSLYEALLPGLDDAFAFLRQYERQGLSEGQYELDGNNVFACVMRYETQDQHSLQFENHEHYLDIHYIRTGQEGVLWTNTTEKRLAIGYDVQSDVGFFPELPGVELPLRQGQFMLLFPDDIHKPKCVLEAPCMVDKAVVKVKL